MSNVRLNATVIAAQMQEALRLIEQYQPDAQIIGMHMTCILDDGSYVATEGVPSNETPDYRTIVYAGLVKALAEEGTRLLNQSVSEDVNPMGRLQS